MRRKIDIPEDLERLADIFSKYSPLYITGGYVRNAITGIACDDIDIASPLTTDKVIDILSNNYQVNTINKRLGTLQIKSTANTYEYTTFRRDSYPKSSGAHKPVEVEFTNDIILDGERRDFTVNAIYYDILNDCIIDNLNGLEDIKNRVIRTTVNPYRVFSEDGLRIMRLVRLSSELDFAIDRDTFNAAKDNINLLRDIASERIIIELDRILLADSKYNLNNLAHYNGMVTLNDIGALKIIFPNVMLNNLEIIRYIEPDIRLSSLLIGNSSEDIRRQLEERKFKNSYIREVSKLNDLLKVKVDNRRAAIEIIIDNCDILDKYSGLLKVFNRQAEYDIILELVTLIEESNLPDKISKLKVKGSDLIVLGIPNAERGRVLRELLIYSIENGINDRELQMKKLRGDKLNV